MSTPAKKVVFITGANTGIGYETVKALIATSQPYHILLGSRSVEKGTAAISSLQKEVPDSPSSIEVVQVDVASDDSINAAYDAVKSKVSHIDTLVNNAGMTVSPKDAKDLSMREIWNITYDVNVSGTNVLTHTFMPLLVQSSDPRLVFLTSGLAQLETMSKGFFGAGIPTPHQAGWPKPVWGSFDSYRCSKTALNMMMLWWHWLLQPDGVKVFSVSPGFLATGLGGSDPAIMELMKARGAGHPSVGGEVLRRVVQGARDEEAGLVVNKDGIQPF